MKGFLRGPAKYPLAVSVVAILLFALGWWLLHGTYIPVLEPSGTIAQSEKQLIVFTVTLSAVVVIPVFILLASFAWRYREGNKKAAYQPEWSHNKRLETIWWGIPILIIGVLSIVTWVTSHSLDPYRGIVSTVKPIEVNVVALQWKWLFIYPAQGVASVNQLTIPVNQPVHFNLTADAPMSAFWIPALGSQIYTMDGMNSTLHLMATKTGNYTGYNTNINGKGYAEMTFAVTATNTGDFNRWVASARSSEPLTMTSYKELAKPNTSKVRLYQLADANLYDEILASYMQPAESQNTTTQNYSPNMTGGAQ